MNHVLKTEKDCDCDTLKHTVEDSYGMFIFEYYPNDVVKLKVWASNQSKNGQWDNVARDYGDVDALWDEVVKARPEVKSYFNIEQVKAFYIFMSYLD